MKRLIHLLIFSVVTISSIHAQNAPTDTSESKNYRLRIFDRIEIRVFDEDYLNTAEGIDAHGNIRLPLVEQIHIADLDINEAESLIERTYQEKRILKSPTVSITVLEYSPKTVSVLGEIPRPGEIPFPNQIGRMDIIEVFSKVGGLTPMSKGKEVRVTRTHPDGHIEVMIVDVESRIEGKNGNADNQKFYVIPGDLIYVEKRWY